MRYAILGDIHGNWEALSAVLNDARQQGVSRFACVGDIVGYNADPVRCVEAVNDMDCVTVCGNHDHFCATRARDAGMNPVAWAAVRWTRRVLRDDHRQFLSGLLHTHQVDGFVIVHNSLAAFGEWRYVTDCGDAWEHFQFQDCTLCFHGHTHVPVVFRDTNPVSRTTDMHVRVESGRHYLINVGSVGQPRDRDPRAAYLVYDAEKSTCSLRRVAYDIGAAQQKIRAAGLPAFLAHRLAHGM